ncbi:hypothetical protein COCNU_06G019520, partial [Cocos nucifera]
RMCYEVKCRTCGKSTWGGCGRHVASVYRRIGEGQHCLCRDWPGVSSTASATGPATDTQSSCVIL